MTKDIEFLNPLDGDFMFKDDGYEKQGKLVIPVYINGSDCSGLKINNVPVEKQGEKFTAEVILDAYENILTLKDKEDKTIQQITVYWAKKSYRKYRLSLDDNIWLFKDIAKNQNSYKSIFDNPYLALYKRLHDKFGTKVHFNIYYEDEDFNLTQMPDKFKDQWRKNSDWIALTFHAKSNFPDKPYENTTYEEITEHCKKVTNEIKRFAGEEVLSPFTTIHWGAVNKEGCKAMRDFGFKGLVGYFRYLDGEPLVSYYLDKEKIDHLNRRDIWKDNDFGLTFVKHDMVINSYERKQVIPTLKKVLSDPHQSGFIELMIHEQYFYPDYSHYQPDYEEKITDAVKLVTDKGYKPAFLKEALK